MRSAGRRSSASGSGESEGLLRGIFDHAREQDRSIIFFDEIDSVAAQRGESHEASRRVVAQLLR